MPSRFQHPASAFSTTGRFDSTSGVLEPSATTAALPGVEPVLEHVRHYNMPASPHQEGGPRFAGALQRPLILPNHHLCDELIDAVRDLAAAFQFGWRARRYDCVHRPGHHDQHRSTIFGLSPMLLGRSIWTAAGSTHPSTGPNAAPSRSPSSTRRAHVAGQPHAKASQQLHQRRTAPGQHHPRHLPGRPRHRRRRPLRESAEGASPPLASAPSAPVRRHLPHRRPPFASVSKPPSPSCRPAGGCWRGASPDGRRCCCDSAGHGRD